MIKNHNAWKLIDKSQETKVISKRMAVAHFFTHFLINYGEKGYVFRGCLSLGSLVEMEADLALLDS